MIFGFFLDLTEEECKQMCEDHIKIFGPCHQVDNIKMVSTDLLEKLCKEFHMNPDSYELRRYTGMSEGLILYNFYNVVPTSPP